MAQGHNSDSIINWYRPDPRAVLCPASSFHTPARLKRLIRQRPFTIRWDDDFRAVMTACSENRDEGTWINPLLIDLFAVWFEEGGVHCLSVFDGDIRVGGIYGVHMGGVFMAESMFSRVSNASSVALVVLVAGLVKAGVELIDMQFVNPHTEKFGVTEIPLQGYLEKLSALKEKPVILKADYFCFDEAISFTQSLIQTS